MTQTEDVHKTTVLIDWGGVLTPPLSTLWDSWGQEHGINAQHFRDVLSAWHDLPPDEGGFGNSPSARFERGEISPDEFEQALAAELSRRGSTTQPDGLLAGALSGLAEHNMPMYDYLRELKDEGYIVGLLSNSWGDCYDRTHWSVFDDMICSGEVGMRKPESRIFRLAAARLDVFPEQVVFVDDLPSNITAAEGLGMSGVLHTDNHTTIDAVNSLLHRT